MAPFARASARTDTNELLSLMIEAVEDYAIYMLDLDGAVMSWNGGAERNTGHKAIDIIGQNHSRFFSREAISAGYPQRALDKARNTGRFRAEGWRRRKDGSCFWAVITLSAVRDRRGKIIGFAAVTRDLSDRREQEIALKTAKDEAEGANKSKSVFLANMSHELRTPLNAVLGFSDMLIAGIPGPLTNKQREYLGHIQSSGDHLLGLINNLLDFAKLDADALILDVEDLDVGRLARKAGDIIQPQANKAGVQILVEVASQIRMRADGRRMMQIFLNLLSNAVKFTPEGGRAILQAGYDGDAVVITVQDTGIGIAQDEIAKVLLRFGQVESALSRKSHGTGLGLPLVKELVELHGGTLALRSQKSIGTRVELRFPHSVDIRPA
jgi:PAS domain S-box-containing protein